MNFIKRNYKKIILGLSLCLSLFIGIFALNNAKADNIAPNYFVENPNYQNVFYSNTINITGYHNYDALNYTHTITSDSISFEFTTDTTTEFDMQGVGIDFITKYYYPYGGGYYDNFMLKNPLIVCIDFKVSKYIQDNGGEWSEFDFDSSSSNCIESALFDGYDFYECFGLIDSYDSSFVPLDSEENNYYYSYGLHLNYCRVYFSIPFGSFENDMQELSTIFFGFKSDLYLEDNMLINFEIYNIEIGNPFVYDNLMQQYKSDYDSKSQQYNDYVDDHSYTNNQYNTLNDNYNDLQDDYNELETSYNKLRNSFNAMINSNAPFNFDNIKSIQVSTSNNGVISDYDDVLKIYDKELQIDSSILRDIIQEYNLQQSSNVGVAIDLKLNNLAYIPFIELKANSSGFEYEFILKNNDTTVFYRTLDTNDGPYDNGLIQDYGDYEFNRVIITIYNIDISHYGDPNSYLLTSISYFDGYSQALKDIQPQFDLYETEIANLNDTISNNTTTINILKSQISNLQEAVNDNLGWASLFLGMADTPLKVVHSVLGFELFGLNLFTTFIGIITILAIVYILKKFF